MAQWMRRPEQAYARCTESVLNEPSVTQTIII